jgi:thymidylate kinase
MRLVEAADVRGRGPRWERWWRRELTAWAATIDITVVLDAPDDILLERIRERGKPHQLKDLPEAAVRKAFGRWRALLEDLIAELHTHGDVSVLRVDTGGKPVAEVVAGTMRPLGLEVAPGVGE